MCARSDAVDALNRAAQELSAACMEYLDVPRAVQPMVKSFEHYALQPVPLDMAVLLGRIR